MAAWDCSAVISTDTIDRATTTMDFSADILARAMFFVQRETFYVAPPTTTTATTSTTTTTTTSTITKTSEVTGSGTVGTVTTITNFPDNNMRLYLSVSFCSE